MVVAVVVWLARICRMSGVEAANWFATGTSVSRFDTTVGHRGSICSEVGVGPDQVVSERGSVALQGAGQRRQGGIELRRAGA